MNQVGLYSTDQKIDQLKRYIDEAQSIEELCEILNLTRVIRNNSREVSTVDVISQIREVDSLLEDSLEYLVNGVIDQGPNYYRDDLSKKVNKIVNGDDLAIRRHVKDLLRQKMTDRFLENKRYFLETEIAKASDFDYLCDLLKKTQSINFSYGSINDSLTISFTIQKAKDNFNFLIKEGNITSHLDDVVEELVAEIPYDLGLNNKVRYLMFETVKEYNLKSPVKESSRIKKVLNKLLKLFK